MAKTSTKGPSAREAEAVRFCEENEPLIEEAGDITRTRIFMSGASLMEPLSRDVKLARDRTVAAADKLTEAVKDAKVPPKEIAARETTYNKELRIFRHRETVFERLEALLNSAQIMREAKIDNAKISQMNGSDLAWQQVNANVQQKQPAKKRSFLSRLFGDRRG